MDTKLDEKTPMLIRDRQEVIVQLVDQNTRLSFAEISKELGISDSTLRRDLNELQKRGLIKLVRGGAESILATLGRGEELIDKRYSLFTKEKEAIAKYAASLIKPNDLVFIDSGSTTEKLCEYITERKATYITIGLKHAINLSRSNLNVIIAPGKVKHITEGLQGSFTIDFLNKFNFSIAFFGALGVTEKGGISTADEEDASIKSSVARRVDNAYLLTDPSKFGVDSSVSFSSLKDMNIITNLGGENLDEYKTKTNLILV